LRKSACKTDKSAIGSPCVSIRSLGAKLAIIIHGFWNCYDHLYSPTALVDTSTAAVVERYEYDVYGKATIRDTEYETRATSQYGNAYLFTGRTLDLLDTGNLKLQYNRNRYYDHYTGRFTTHDPLGISPTPPKLKGFGPSKQYKAWCACISWYPGAAQSLERGWCTSCYRDCYTFCILDVPVGEAKKCMKKCDFQHALCFVKATRGKCKFEYEISG